MPSSDFRISNQMLVAQSLANLQKNAAKLSDLQDQASSLKRLRKPSDAPADVASAMHLHADLSRNDQVARNLDDAAGWLGTADSALNCVRRRSCSGCGELVVQARNASVDADRTQKRSPPRSTTSAERSSASRTRSTRDAPIFAGTGERRHRVPVRRHLRRLLGGDRAHDRARAAGAGERER